MTVQTTLNFYGRTEEAIKFYCQAIEAETLFMMRFRDRPDHAPLKPGTEEKIFHATFRIGSTTIMASDCGCEQPTTDTFGGFSLALRVETQEKAERFFTALSDGGRVFMPLQETFWAAGFGAITDRFGVPLVINCGKPAQS